MRIKKERLKGDLQETKALPSLAIAGQRIKRLEEDARLNKENYQLLEQFVIWQYNGYRDGLTQGQLNQSLLVINRETSES